MGDVSRILFAFVCLAASPALAREVGVVGTGGSTTTPDFAIVVNPDLTTTSNLGCGCHTSGNSVVIRQLSPALDGLTLPAGSTGTFLVSATTLKNAAGLAAVVSAGSVDPADGTTKKIGGVVTHNDAPQVVTGFQVQVTAPATPGVFAIGAAFNAVDHGGTNASDLWGVGALLVTATGECNDGVDNDADNDIDLADAGCADPSDPTETGPTACDDGLDSDGDGFIDLQDPGCADATDPSERSAALVCDDGLDNDADRLVDLADPVCSGPTAPKEKAKCQDGRDNDRDGRVDFDGGRSLGLAKKRDPTCANKPWKNTEGPLRR